MEVQHDAVSEEPRTIAVSKALAEEEVVHNLEAALFSARYD